jgi:hypothetical protein
MKFTIENATIEGMNNALSVVSTKDTVTTLTIGEKEFGDKLLMVANVTSVGEQVTLNLTCKKPADFDGTPVTIAVKSQTFTAITSSLLKFKEDIVIDITDGVVKAESGKAAVNLETVVSIPEKIEGGDVMLQMMMKGEEFQSFIRRGFTSGADAVSDNGTSNAVMTINVTDGTAEGFSTTGSRASIAKGKVLLPKAPEGNEAVKAQVDAMSAVLDAYCEKTGQKKEALAIVLPGVCVKHMQTLAQGQAQVQLAVTAQYVNVIIGNVGVYTFRQGAKAPTQVAVLRQYVAGEYKDATRVVFDAAAVIQAVQFINDMDRLDGLNGKKAVKLIVKDGGLKMVSAGGGKADTAVTPLAIEGGDVEMSMNGQALRQMLDVVDRGNVMLSFGENMVILENGTIADGPSESVLAFLMKVKDTQEDAGSEESDEASEDSAEGSGE